MQSSVGGREEHENKLQKLEHRRLLKTVVVPTSDAEVRAFLRALKEPVIFFGEGKVRGIYCLCLFAQILTRLFWCGCSWNGGND